MKTSALAKLETDESNVCLERERCFSSTKRLLGGVVEVFEESGDESDADGENGGTLKCRNIYFFVDDDDDDGLSHHHHHHHHRPFRRNRV